MARRVIVRTLLPDERRQLRAKRRERPCRSGCFRAIGSSPRCRSAARAPLADAGHVQPSAWHEYFLVFCDVHADCLRGTFTNRKRVADLSAAFRRLLPAAPALRNPRQPPARARSPTDASWLNLIELQFGVMNLAALNGTDDASYRIRRHRLARYVRYRNRRHQAHRHPLTRLLTVPDIKFGTALDSRAVVPDPRLHRRAKKLCQQKWVDSISLYR